MNSEVERRKSSLRDEYGFFPNSEELFEYIVSENKGKPPLESEYKREEFLVKGCVSSLWLVPFFDSERNVCHFKSDADSIITRGVASIVCKLYDGLSPEEILSLDPSVLGEVGISSALSPNRRNGLSQLCSRIFSFAKSCSEK